METQTSQYSLDPRAGRHSTFLRTNTTGNEGLSREKLRRAAAAAQGVDGKQKSASAEPFRPPFR
ncbi:UNVERIFIED_ORG: hypothetical protein GGI63_003454 [Rhizobium esperanzae]